MLALPPSVLVDAAVAHLQTVVVQEEPAVIALTMRSTPATAACPLCGLPSSRIHSRYHRYLADVSWALVPVVNHRPILALRHF